MIEPVSVSCTSPAYLDYSSFFYESAAAAAFCSSVRPSFFMSIDGTKNDRKMQIHSIFMSPIRVATADMPRKTKLFAKHFRGV